MRIAAKECAKQGLSDPHVAYYQCGQICGAILSAANDLGISGIELIGCHVKYPEKTEYSEEDGKYAGHYILKHGSVLYDFTLRQFIPDSDFPFISDESDCAIKEIYKDLHQSWHLSTIYDQSRKSNSQLTDSIVERFKAER